jgi:peptidoglycan/xylan/chitin deacetylase (PgdA/CDA1 family)
MSKKWVAVFGFAVLFFIAVGFTTHKTSKRPTPPVMGKKEFMAKSYERSRELMGQGIQALKEKRMDDAVRSLVEAIAVFPPNTEAYAILSKIFLMTKQEISLYKTLEHAGRSYSSFDDILKVVNDADLANIPLPVESADIYIAPFKDNKKMALSFMFDDGESSVYTGVMPLFEKYGYRASISVVAGQVAPMPGNPERGSWSEWKDAVARGFEIASHSMSHRDAKTLKPEDLRFEIDDAKAMIEKNVGKKVSSYVFPMDSYTDTVLHYVTASHPAARHPDYLRAFYGRTVDIMYGGQKFSVGTANRLVDIGIKSQLWLIAECHGLDINNPNNYKPLTAEFLDEHLRYVRMHSPDLWVDTFGNVFEYLSLRKGTQVLRKDVAEREAEIVLHHPSLKVMPRPLTVVLKVQDQDVSVVAAQTSDGGSLKAWPCGANHVCVNIAAYDQSVRVIWGGQKS